MSAISVPAINHNGDTAFYVAAANGHLDAVAALLADAAEKGEGGARALILQKDAAGRTALYRAAAGGHTEVVKLLLSRADALHLQSEVVCPPSTIWKEDESKEADALDGEERGSEDNGNGAVLGDLVAGGRENDVAAVEVGDDEDVLTPIHAAAASGHAEVIRAIIAHHVAAAAAGATHPSPSAAVSVAAVVNSPSSVRRRTPLHLAARLGYDDAVRALIESGAADVNAQTADDKRTPLFYAAQHGHAAVVGTLLQHIIAASRPEHFWQREHPANMPDIDGFAPLHAAVRRGHTNVVSVFIKLMPPLKSPLETDPLPPYTIKKSGSQRRGNCTGRDYFDQDSITFDLTSSLYYSRSTNKFDGGSVTGEDEVDEYGDPVIFDDDGAGRFWHLSTYERRDDFEKSDDISTSEILFSETTVLHFAAYYGYASIIEAFLSADPAHIDMRDSEEQTALHCAARYGHLDCVLALLKYRASVNAKTMDGSTALHFAAFGGHVSVVDALINNDYEAVNIDFEDQHSRNPLLVAARRGCVAVVRRLAAEGANVFCSSQSGRRNALHEAAEMGRAGIVEAVIAAAQPRPWRFLNTRNAHYDETPLHIAASKGHLKVVKVLLAAGASKKARCKRGLTPLHLAAEAGHLPVVEALLEAGVDVSAVAPGGYTPLHFAVASGHLEVVRLLIASNARIDLRGWHGSSPLHFACECGFVAIVKELLRCGADADAQSVGRCTPLMMAAHFPQGTAVIVNTLLAHGASVNATDAKGATALHWSARWSYPAENDENETESEDSSGIVRDRTSATSEAVVKALLAAGADPSATNVNGATPSHIAHRSRSNGHLLWPLLKSEMAAGDGNVAQSVMTN